MFISSAFAQTAPAAAAGGDLQSSLTGMLPKLTAENRDAAVAFAKVPEQIRGYGHVKARHLQSARKLWEAALQKFHQA